MHIQFKQFFLVPVTTFFCTIAFSSPLIDAGQGVSLEAGNTPWSYVGSESVTQQPLLLARGPTKSREEKFYYCQIRQKHQGGFKIKTKKAPTEAKRDERIVRCNNRAPKYQCFINKCEDVPSPSYS